MRRWGDDGHGLSDVVDSYADSVRRDSTIREPHNSLRLGMDPLALDSRPAI